MFPAGYSLRGGLGSIHPGTDQWARESVIRGCSPCAEGVIGRFMEWAPSLSLFLLFSLSLSLPFSFFTFLFARCFVCFCLCVLFTFIFRQKAVIFHLFHLYCVVLFSFSRTSCCMCFSSFFVTGFVLVSVEVCVCVCLGLWFVCARMSFCLYMHVWLSTCIHVFVFLSVFLSVSTCLLLMFSCVCLRLSASVSSPCSDICVFLPPCVCFMSLCRSVYPPVSSACLPACLSLCTYLTSIQPPVPPLSRSSSSPVPSSSPLLSGRDEDTAQLLASSSPRH